MSITAECSACRKQYRLADAMAGKRVKCRDCGQPFMVPDAAGASLTASTPPPPPLPVRLKPSEQPAVTPYAQKNTPAPAPSSRRRLIRYSCLVGIPLLLAAILAATSDHWLIWFVDRAPQTQPWMETDVAPDGLQLEAPQLPAARHPFADIEQYDVQIPARNADPAMAVSIYLPAGRHDPKSLPCVFIAPAGSWMHGMSIGDGDRAEHYPYVRAGFAVVCYELSGSMADPSKKKPTYAELAGPTAAFMNAAGGIQNAWRAINYVVNRVPEANPLQFYACGHSSAAVVALDVASADPRIRACCAYAPRTDVEAWWKPVGMNKYIVGFDKFATFHSPLRQVNLIHCPILLFHADDDSAVPLADNQAYADAAAKAGKPVTFVRVPTGDHYDSMLKEGIPRGIEFMKQNGATPLPPVTQ